MKATKNLVNRLGAQSKKAMCKHLQCHDSTPFPLFIFAFWWTLFPIPKSKQNNWMPPSMSNVEFMSKLSKFLRIVISCYEIQESLFGKLADMEKIDMNFFQYMYIFFFNNLEKHLYQTNIIISGEVELEFYHKFQQHINRLYPRHELCLHWLNI